MSDTYPTGDPAGGNAGHWSKYAGLLNVVKISEHVNQVWGVQVPESRVFYKPGVTSSTPEGINCTFWLSVYYKKSPAWL